MANLLERSSLVLTPTAYNNGEALCIKPDDGSGDFDFSRNSAATRVNAQGLVENVQILSSNLVQNGDFSEEGVQEVSNGSFSQEGSELIVNGNFATDSNWGKQTSNWTIANGYAVCDGLQTSNSSLFQDFAVVNGVSYKIDFTITDSVNNLNLILGATTIGQYGDGTHTVYVEKDSGGPRIFFQATASNAFQGSIDNVSVREVGQDWVLSGSGWSIGEDKIVSVNGSSYGVYQLNALVSGKTYKITYEVKDYVSGQFGIRANTIGGITAAANGVYTDYLTSNGDKVYLMGFGAFNGSVTNISVKEVGQNWQLGTGVSIGSNEAIFTSTPSGQSVGQNAVAAALPNGALAKVSFEVLTRTEGTFGIYFSGTLVGTLASAGVFTGYFTKGTETSFYIRALGTTSGTISNVNVIQISSDTNLPRINYENFSYQDVLGSEEVLNGGFDDGGAYWANIGNLAVFENSSVIFENNAKIYQNVVSDLTKTYNIEIQFSSISGNGIQLLVGNGNSFVSYSVSDIINNGNKITIAKTSFIGSGLLFIYSQNSSTSAVITNVSVKEYLGQEVVPDSGCGSWLFEPQSTNLITYSEDFSNASWFKNNVILTPNQGISPNGGNNAFKYFGATTSQDLRKSENVSNNYTYSLYVKAINSPYIRLRSVDGSCWFDMTTNAVATNTFASAEIKNVGNNWYRISVTSSSFTASNNFYVHPHATDNTTSELNEAEFLLWGAQVEQQSYATSYIPTSGSQVTRNQDVCTNGGSLATINSTEGVLYAEIAALANSGTTRAIYVSNGTTANRFWLEFDAAANRFEARYIANGTTSANFFHTVSDIKDFNKIAFKWKENDFSLYVNGLEVGNDTSGSAISADTLNRIDFHNQASSSVQNFFGKTKALAVWKEALSDSELQSLTTI